MQLQQVLLYLLDSFVPAFFYVPLLVNAREYLVLLLRARNHLIDLVVSGDLAVALLIVLCVVLADEVLQSRLSLDVGGLVVEHARLDDLRIEVLLDCGLAEDSLLNLCRRDQPVNAHFPLLTDTMCAVLGLLVHLWVPIRVEDDHSVTHLKIESMTSCPGAQQEHLFFRVPVVEDLQIPSTVLMFCAAV